MKLLVLQGKYRSSGHGHTTELDAAQDAMAVWSKIRGPGLTRSLAEAWADADVQAAMPEQAQRFFQELQQVSLWFLCATPALECSALQCAVQCSTQHTRCRLSEDVVSVLTAGPAGCKHRRCPAAGSCRAQAQALV